MDTAFYKLLVENPFDGVYFVDTENRITFWNKGAERITGYSESEVKGSRCSDNIPFGMLFIDVDRFKDVNNRYGHEAGDLVLKVAGKTAANLMRKVDIIARWGGEEFIAIIPVNDLATLRSAAERIRVFI